MLYMFYIVSSPYLFVFGDHHVLHYTWADDVAARSSEAYSRSEASLGDKFYQFFYLW